MLQNSSGLLLRKYRMGWRSMLQALSAVTHSISTSPTSARTCRAQNSATSNIDSTVVLKMPNQHAAGAQCSSCTGGVVAAQRLRPLCRYASSIRLRQQIRRDNGVGRRRTSVIAQAKQVKGEQEASASAQESVQAEQEGQADNVATPIQEHLPNQQVCGPPHEVISCLSATRPPFSQPAVDAGSHDENVSGRLGLLERCNTEAEGQRWG